MPQDDRQDIQELEGETGLGSVLTPDGFIQHDRELDHAADKALKERPSFSIRARLVLAFSIFFLFPLFITIWSISALSQIHEKLLFLEIADDYKIEIQLARRFEKNYLLYGTNLEDAMQHAHAARQLADENAERFRRVIGNDVFDTMNRHNKIYIEALEGLTAGERANYEDSLRKHGSVLCRLAQEFLSKERARAASMMSLTRKIPFVFVAALFILMVILVTFLARHLLRTLNRFMGYTERIAAGNFAPITPKRRYRDEFSMLALHLNRMVRELDRQHRVLVESHKLRAMGTLVAGVAHEINNPMNNILLSASVLREEFEFLDDNDKQEMIDDVIGQARRSKKIVGNLLDFARESKTKIEGLDIKKILEETVQLVSNQIRLKKIRLEMDLPEEMPLVHGDRQLLSQVFMNLLINAIDVLPERGVISIGKGTAKRPGFLAIEVTDNGPGIPEDILDQIFDPFFTTKPKDKGTGLGLSVSRGIVRKLGGQLLVRSHPGKGSTFIVQLPVTTVPSHISSAGENNESLQAKSETQ